MKIIFLCRLSIIDSAKPKKHYEVLYYKDSNGLFLSVSKHVEDKVMFLDRLDSKEDLDNEQAPA